MTQMVILTLFLTFSYAGGVVTQEYSSIQACQKAAGIIKADADKRGANILALSCTFK